MVRMPVSISYRHEPEEYICPFCDIVRGGDQTTVIWRDDTSIAFLALHQPLNNHGSLLLCPLEHFENIYVLPEPIGAHLFGVSKRLALALKAALGCDGVTIRQHNEPAGSQDVWHYHVHVVPRFANDRFYSARLHLVSLEERISLAELIRGSL